MIILDGYTFQQVGCLNLSDKKDYDLGSDLRDLHDELGAKYEIYIGDELTKKFSDLKAEDDEYGILDPRGGYSEAHTYIPALRKKIENMGVKIFENEEVRNFTFSGNKTNGLITFSKTENKEKSYNSDAIICAVNAWTNLILSPIDFKIPMKKKRELDARTKEYKLHRRKLKMQREKRLKKRREDEITWSCIRDRKSVV